MPHCDLKKAMTIVNTDSSPSKADESLTTKTVERLLNMPENFLGKEIGIVRPIWRYSCRNCRTPLFCEKDIIDHSKDKPIINFVEKSEDGVTESNDDNCVSGSCEGNH